MRVMEVNRKGWTAWCMDITCMGLRGVREEGGGGASLGWGGCPHRSTASQRTADFLAHHGPFSITHQASGWEET